MTWCLAFTTSGRTAKAVRPVILGKFQRLRSLSCLSRKLTFSQLSVSIKPIRVEFFIGFHVTQYETMETGLLLELAFYYTASYGSNDPFPWYGCRIQQPWHSAPGLKNEHILDLFTCIFPTCGSKTTKSYYFFTNSFIDLPIWPQTVKNKEFKIYEFKTAGYRFFFFTTLGVSDTCIC